VRAALEPLAHPGNWRLLAPVGVAVCLLVLGPALWSPQHVLLASGAALAAGYILFSLRRALAAMVVLTVALPVHVIDSGRLPLGLRPEEILLVAAFTFAFVDLVYRRGLDFTRARPDGLVALFLALAALSVAIGLYRGNDPSAVVRNARYAFYYSAFFLAVQVGEERVAARYFVPVCIAAGLAVSAEYILEFVGAIDLSAGSRFVRLGRRQGVFLPAALLLVANVFLHDPRRWGRTACIALFLFMGVALALTMGRGMWVAFGAGLAVTAWLREAGRPADSRRLWRAAVVAAALAAVLAAGILSFQRLTGAAISAHAVERSRTFVDFSRDVQVLGRILNYATAAETIAAHPALGSGQGTTLTSYSFNPETGRFETWTSWTVDSLYLTLWLKMGLAGLLVFTGLCVQVLRRAHRAFHRATDPATRAFAAAGTAITAAMLILGLSDGSLVNGRFALVFAVLFGLLARVADQVEGRGAPAAAATPQPQGMS